VVRSGNDAVDVDCNVWISWRDAARAEASGAREGRRIRY
jgi:hypothetical protein